MWMKQSCFKQSKTTYYNDKILQGTHFVFWYWSSTWNVFRESLKIESKRNENLLAVPIEKNVVLQVEYLFET